MRDVAGEGQHVAGLQIVSLAGDDDPNPAFEASEVFAGSRQMRRAAKPSAGREIHDDHHPVRHRLGDQRPLGYALASLPRADFIGGPFAYLGAGRGEQLIDRHAERACHLDEDSQGGVGLARFQIGDRRARQRRRRGERILGQRPRMPQADQVARQIEAGAFGLIGLLVYRLDFPPIGWT
jgi:hypothetical protein